MTGISVRNEGFTDTTRTGEESNGAKEMGQARLNSKPQLTGASVLGKLLPPPLVGAGRRDLSSRVTRPPTSTTPMGWHCR